MRPASMPRGSDIFTQTTGAASPRAGKVGTGRALPAAWLQGARVAFHQKAMAGPNAKSEADRGLSARGEHRSAGRYLLQLGSHQDRQQLGGQSQVGPRRELDAGVETRARGSPQQVYRLRTLVIEPLRRQLSHPRASAKAEHQPRRRSHEARGSAACDERSLGVPRAHGSDHRCCPKHVGAQREGATQRELHADLRPRRNPREHAGHCHGVEVDLEPRSMGHGVAAAEGRGSGERDTDGGGARWSRGSGNHC